VLSDAEIATYLMLRYVRARRPGKHEDAGVFVTAGWRETFSRLHRSTWRSADMLYRLRLVDKIPATGRTFRTGKVDDPKKLAMDARKPVVRFKINDAALQANAVGCDRPVRRRRARLRPPPSHVGGIEVGAHTWWCDVLMTCRMP
jgi:hypothetical protein